MQLQFLTSVDIFRDGGSYEACFRLFDGTRFVVHLEAHPYSPSDGELRHARLFAYVGRDMPSDVKPIPKGSDAERELLLSISTFIEASKVVSNSPRSNSKEALERLKELAFYIPLRDDGSSAQTA